MNISEACRKVMNRYPYIEEYLALGVINYRGLAREILEEVKRELGREVKIQSVVTAVRRVPTIKIQFERDEVLRILAESDVNLKYDIGVITIKLGPETSKRIEKLYRGISVKDTFQVIQGNETLTIVSDEMLMALLDDIFKGNVIESKKNLASIVVTSPEDIAETAGVIAHLASVLAMEKINVVEMMSSYIETLFIVDEEDALKAIEVVRGEIKRARR